MRTKLHPQSDTDGLLTQIGELSESTDMPVYAVGGFVRDCLLNHPVDEIDFVVIGDGPQFASNACKAMKGHGWVVYKKFGTASFMVDNFRLEFVTARKEIYQADSRNPEVLSTDLAEDLSRRDFTVNTMAMHLDTKHFGLIIDPFKGKKDIKKKLIRTPLDPVQTFSEDPLRIMRAARFASQLQFEIHPDALQAMQMERERLKIVSQERITAELLKILSHPRPSIGLRILQKTQVFEIIFPEISALVGIEQRDTYHHKDVFEHTMKVLDNVAAVSDNLLLRFSALVHDIGKPRVKRFVDDIGWTFHGHEVTGVRMLKPIAQKLKLSNEYQKYSREMTRLHMRPIQLIGEDVTDSAIRRLIVDSGDKLEDLMTLCRADITSGNPNRVKRHLTNFDYVAKRIEEVEEKDRMRAFQSPVRGDEIMKAMEIQPGPYVGIFKRRIEEAILEGIIPNEHDAAFNFLHQIKEDVLSE
ncbi:HD domain-containing protein [candidate division KSB1 bacterium]|nr:HD domain-containing protein [candidate division KSB1 bacterium]